MNFWGFDFFDIIWSLWPQCSVMHFNSLIQAPKLNGFSCFGALNFEQLTPPIYLNSIFAIFQSKIFGLKNLIFILFQTCVLQATAGRKIQFKLGKKSSSSNSIFQTGELENFSADKKEVCHQMVSTVKKQHRKCAFLQKVAYYSRHDVDFW